MTEKKLELDKMLATCGHDDLLGYFSNTPCRKCVDKAHAKAVGK